MKWLICSASLALATFLSLAAQVPIEISGWWCGPPDMFQTTFDPADSIYFAKDTMPGNAWEMGVPAGPVFHSAMAGSSTILTTDLDSTFPIAAHSTIQMTFHVCESYGLEFSILHKMHSRDSIEGGWLEISYNHSPWQNIIVSPYYNHGGSIDVYDTTFVLPPPAQYGFSGIDTMDWRNSFFYIEDLASGIVWDDTIDIRFHFLSDSMDDGFDGWAIGMVSVWAMWESIGDPAYRGSMVVAPNPSVDGRFRIDLKNPAMVKGQLSVLDSWGRCAARLPWSAGDDINLDSLPAGIYMLMLEEGGQTHFARWVRD